MRMPVIFSMLLLSLPICAAVPQWTIIPEESSLTFTATQNDAPLTGQFTSFGGEIFWDPQDYKSSRVRITVNMNSVSLSYQEIKTTLLNADWFNVKLYPEAVFTAAVFNKTGAKTYQAAGTLVIRDKSVPTTLTFTVEQPQPQKSVVEGTASLKRSAFGVGQGEWAATDQIKDEVVVSFKVTAVKK